MIGVWNENENAIEDDLGLGVETDLLGASGEGLSLFDGPGDLSGLDESQEASEAFNDNEGQLALNLDIDVDIDVSPLAIDDEEIDAPAQALDVVNVDTTNAENAELIGVTLEVEDHDDEDHHVLHEEDHHVHDDEDHHVHGDEDLHMLHEESHHGEGHDVLPGVDISYVNVASDSYGDLPSFESTIDLSQTFLLDSNPDAAHTIYLDFDGHTTTHWGWTQHNNDENIVSAAFDLDGDTLNFSEVEQERIQYIWQRVAEDFSPFDVNVTTADPGIENLRRTSDQDDAWGTRVVIGAGDWLGEAAGGVAHLSTFAYSDDLPVFVFTNYLANGSEKATAEAISHEVGHTLGLEHDGQYEQSYYTGEGSGETGWAPILGAGYYQELTQWSQGEYAGATNTQDDLAIITTQNGFGYRDDDHGDSFGDAEFIPLRKILKNNSNSPASSGKGNSNGQGNNNGQENKTNSLFAGGLIEQNTDSDFFKFRTGKGPVSIQINPAERGANLDILANLYDKNRTLIATSNPSDSLSASFEMDLDAGRYFIEVMGTGNGDPQNGGYSDYGSLGQYTISGEVQEDVSSVVTEMTPVESGVDGYAQAALALMPLMSGTIVADQDGSWFDPTTWVGGVVPGDGDDVQIAEGITVTYDAESDARLNKVCVDGNLVFASDQNTKMIVDSLIANPTGALIIGTEDDPIQADKTAQIIIDGQSAVSDDPQMGKGVISMGKTHIYGADKLDFVSLQDAFAGDNKLILDLPAGETTPLGWQEGDQLVLGGTQYNRNGSNADNSKFQDEVLIITEINGNEISFINQNITSGNNTVLRFNHARAQGFEDQLGLYVANTTRNVSIASENGSDTPIENRGHVMLMHSDDVQVFNAGFYDLGRTDKNQDIDDVGVNVDGTTGNGTNVRGRYALHFHHVGINDSHDMSAMDSDMSGMDDGMSGMDHGMDHMPSTPVASGNAIVGSPGWGLVHHNSHANLDNNVVFDVVGSGIVAEGGAETGSWNNNITIKTTGDSDTHHGFGHAGKRVLNYDLGFNGEGYWVQGAGQVVMTDNIAVSAAGAGLIVFGGGDGGASARDQHTIAVSDLPAEWADIAEGYGDGSKVDVATVPLRELSGFEAYNVDDGIVTWGTMLNSDGQHEFNVPGAHALDTVVPAHEYRATVDDFKVWGVRNDGVQLWYSSQYDLSNGLILADQSGWGSGINNNGKNHTFKNLHIEDFKVGITLPNDGDGESSIHQHRDLMASVIEDSTISSVYTNFSYFNNDSHYLEIKGDNTFEVTSGTNDLPVAAFTANAIGATAYELDASASFDTDPWSVNSKFETQGIAAYAWDFDNDGIIDDFGRDVRHYFESTGEHEVGLTVWDQDGASTSLTQTINVQDTAYGNAFLNGEFTTNPTLNYSRGSSIDADQGWAKTTNNVDPLLGQDGAFVFTTGNASLNGLTQVVEDEGMRRGAHTLSVTLKNTEGHATYLNGIDVKLYGVNGQFANKVQDFAQGPQKVGSLPMDSVELFSTSLGGENFDWQTFDWDVDLGVGYEYLVAEIFTKNGWNSGDFIAIDSLSLIGETV